jgi:hypothetical protein
VSLGVSLSKGDWSLSPVYSVTDVVLVDQAIVVHIIDTSPDTSGILCKVFYVPLVTVPLAPLNNLRRPPVEWLVRVFTIWACQSCASVCVAGRATSRPEGRLYTSAAIESYVVPTTRGLIITYIHTRIETLADRY